MTESVKINSTPKRALALDALRGLAILMMTFASAIPFGVLPSWMYHAQEPPPLHIGNPNLPGITWVDLVFPFFLFAMGAAIPLSLSRKLKTGFKNNSKVFSNVLFRGLSLVGFAIYICHISPYSLSKIPDWRTWLTALFGFSFVFPILCRLPDEWGKPVKYAVRSIGWAGAIIFMAVIRFPDGTGFSVYKSDIIILVLSNVAAFGSLIWIASRNNTLLRLSFLGLLFAIRLSSRSENWVHTIWTYTPAEWLLQFRFLVYLFIVIPGTIAGDLILNWMNATNIDKAGLHNWGRKKFSIITLLMFVITAEVVAGLKTRYVFASFMLSLLICAVLWYLTRNPGNAAERFISALLKWGTYWLILGFLFEPFEGGIKKDPSTFSYYFISAGLAIFMLIAFTIIIDIAGRKKLFNLLIHSGQNPMAAYGGFNNLVVPLLALTKLNLLINYLTPTPWLGVIGGAFVTYLVALSAAFFTKKKIFLRT